MTGPRRLPKPMRGYRIGDPAGAHPVFSPDGAQRVSGRRQQVGDPVIYPG